MRESSAFPSHHFRHSLAITMPAPCSGHPSDPQCQLFCPPGASCTHKNNETVQASSPKQAQRQAEAWSTVPGSAGAIGGQQVSERGRGPAGTGREQVPMDKDQAGTGRSGRKQVLTGGELVSRAAADKEQPWIGREEE